MRISRVAFLLVILMLASCDRKAPDDVSGMNVLLIIIDTLRADHLGYWGYERDTTPTLDSLAESGSSWMAMQGQSSWTLPSTASMLTGLSPREHHAGMYNNSLYGLASSIPSLQAIVHAKGWKTCGIFNVIFLSEDFGFHRGFDHFDCRGVTGNTGCRRADQTVDDALEWLGGLERDSRFLMVLHFYDPHIPYDPPAPFDTLFADPSYTVFSMARQQMNMIFSVNDDGSEITNEGLENLVDLYDGEIAFTDAEIGRLFASMRSNGFSDSTLIIVVADHGEEFMDHSGMEHGRTLYQEVTHVPLIVNGPGIPGGVRVEEPVAHIDIMPTILSYLKLEIPENLQGRNILESEYPDIDIPASNLLWGKIQQASIRRGNYKIIWNADDSGTEYYDLYTDPAEHAPLEDPDESMIEAVEFYWSTPPVAEAPSVFFSEVENNQLRDLGYVR